METFHWADYIVFIFFLLISAAIGVYFALSGGRQRTTREFLLADRSASVVPVALSMIASFMSALSIIGLPAEVYFSGTMISMVFLGYFLYTAIGAHIFVPIYHRMKITSAHEYLERRFNYRIRVVGCILYSFMTVLYLSVVLYAPALTFAVVTGFPLWVSIIILGTVCTFYTVLGGLKAVIWTDTFQMLVIFGGVLTLIIKGAIQVGGFAQVMELSSQGDRIQFDVVDPDPRVRHSVWTQSIGGMFQFLSLVGANQTMIQRYISIKKRRDAQASLYVNMLGNCVAMCMLTILGLVMYAYFASCDPLLAGKIAAPDQIVPYYMMEILGDVHGLPGLFLACVFSAALSTVSSSLNSLAAVWLEDLVKPLCSLARATTLKDNLATWLARALAGGFGLLTIGLSYVAPYMGPTLFMVALSIFGTAGGPLMALFALGIFFPFVNSIGAFCGVLASLGVTYWVHLGHILNKPFTSNVVLMPRFDDGCPAPDVTLSLMQNVTAAAITTISTEATTITTTASMLNATDLMETVATSDVSDWLIELYKLSYMWYGLLSIGTGVVVGVVVSLLTCARRGLQPLDRRLLFLCGESVCSSAPAQLKTFVQCGYEAPDVKEPTSSDSSSEGSSSCGHPMKEEINTAFVADDFNNMEGAVTSTNTNTNTSEHPADRPFTISDSTRL